MKILSIKFLGEKLTLKQLLNQQISFGNIGTSKVLVCTGD